MGTLDVHSVGTFSPNWDMINSMSSVLMALFWVNLPLPNGGAESTGDVLRAMKSSGPP